MVLSHVLTTVRMFPLWAQRYQNGNFGIYLNVIQLVFIVDLETAYQLFLFLCSHRLD